MKHVLLLSALLLLVSLAGCNTMRGFGQDISKVGSEIEEAAN
ncbi:entericidin A/B family lipoprotein [Halomonas sp. PR-M31]|nr:entericidin A/B family lipoprotein [Halomonas sp. PR-M31]